MKKCKQVLGVVGQTWIMLLRLKGTTFVKRKQNEDESACAESAKDSQLTSARKIHTNANSPRVAYSKSSPGMRANTRYKVHKLHRRRWGGGGGGGLETGI